MKLSRVTLDQWLVFQAVVDTGGFAQAAEELHRSQSSISYAMAKLQDQLGIQVLKIEGRKAQLTHAGSILLQWVRTLTDDALALEELGQQLAKGMATEITLVVEIAFPNKLLVKVLKEFAELHPTTRVQLQEVVLSEANDAIDGGEVDLVITPMFQDRIQGESLLHTEFLAVVNPNHPIMKIEQPGLKALQKYHQVVIRDTGRSPVNAGWLKSKYRWTVSSMSSALEFIRAGLGFAWLPTHIVNEYIESEQLVPIPLVEGARRVVPLQIVFAKSAYADSPSRVLASLFQMHAADWHP